VVPPLTNTVKVVVWPTETSWGEAEKAVIWGVLGAVTFRKAFFETEWLDASVTVTVTVYCPAVVGVQVNVAAF
jgi:predicted phage tail protein